MRNFQIIGEATKRLSDDLRQKHPGIPWRKIAGFRDVLVHDYGKIIVDEVWSVVQDDLPGLKVQIAAILRLLEAESNSDDE